MKNIFRKIKSAGYLLKTEIAVTQIQLQTLNMELYTRYLNQNYIIGLGTQT